MNNEAISYPTLGPGAVCVMTLDAARRVAHANAEFRRALGYPAAAWHQRPLHLCCHAEVPPQVLRDIWATLDDGCVWTAPMHWQRADGAGVWMRTVFAPMQRESAAGWTLVVGMAAAAGQVQTADRVYRAIRRHAQARPGPLVRQLA